MQWTSMDFPEVQDDSQRVHSSLIILCIFYCYWLFYEVYLLVSQSSYVEKFNKYLKDIESLHRPPQEFTHISLNAEMDGIESEIR